MFFFPETRTMSDSVTEGNGIFFADQNKFIVKLLLWSKLNVKEKFIVQM